MFISNLPILSAYGIIVSPRIWVMVIKEAIHNKSIDMCDT